MCLFVIDGTWSRDFNSKYWGKDNSGGSVGNQDTFVMSNSRRFYISSKYPDNQKFYYGGPRLPLMGSDSRKIFSNVIVDIEREIVNGNCTEISLVGWSRGAAIATEIAQALLEKEFARIYKRISKKTTRGTRAATIVDKETAMIPEIKFLGLFDSVEMIPNAWLSRKRGDNEWGELIPDKVNYFSHIYAGDRSGLMGVMDFKPRNPKNFAKKSNMHTMPLANHGDVGGFSHSIFAKEAYNVLRRNADEAGVK